MNFTKVEGVRVLLPRTEEEMYEAVDSGEPFSATPALCELFGLEMTDDGNGPDDLLHHDESEYLNPDGTVR